MSHCLSAKLSTIVKSLCIARVLRHFVLVPHEICVKKLLLTETIYPSRILKDKLNTCLRVALLLQAWLSIPPKILPIRSHFRRKLHLFDFSRHKARDKSGVASQSQAIRLATIAPMRRKAPLGTVAGQPGPLLVIR